MPCTAGPDAERATPVKKKTSSKSPEFNQNSTKIQPNQQNDKTTKRQNDKTTKRQTRSLMISTYHHTLPSIPHTRLSSPPHHTIPHSLPHQNQEPSFALISDDLASPHSPSTHPPLTAPYTSPPLPLAHRCCRERCCPPMVGSDFAVWMAVQGSVDPSAGDDHHALCFAAMSRWFGCCWEMGGLTWLSETTTLSVW